ncbi:hypothetical protein LSAT2_006764 [Lamellibrachia satsuma]|nr:hypothetical protein LSAT2_006764 [Lamellibrachia satsuma]
MKRSHLGSDHSEQYLIKTKTVKTIKPMTRCVIVVVFVCWGLLATPATAQERTRYGYPKGFNRDKKYLMKGKHIILTEKQECRSDFSSSGVYVVFVLVKTFQRGSRVQSRVERGPAMAFKRAAWSVDGRITRRLQRLLFAGDRRYIDRRPDNE